MHRFSLLSVCAVMLAVALASPSRAQANDCDGPFRVYERYARQVVLTAVRGGQIMDDVTDEAVAEIRRLLHNGHYERARAVAADAIELIEKVNDLATRKVSMTVKDGVEELKRFEGHVPDWVLRHLIESLVRLGRRAVGYLDNVEAASIEEIKSLFPSPSPSPMPRQLRG